jgi:hypothetical protein
VCTPTPLLFHGNIDIPPLFQVSVSKSHTKFVLAGVGIAIALEKKLLTLYH